MREIPEKFKNVYYKMDNDICTITHLIYLALFSPQFRHFPPKLDIIFSIFQNSSITEGRWPGVPFSIEGADKIWIKRWAPEVTFMILACLIVNLQKKRSMMREGASVLHGKFYVEKHKNERTCQFERNMRKIV